MNCVCGQGRSMLFVRCMYDTMCWQMEHRIPCCSFGDTGTFDPDATAAFPWSKTTNMLELPEDVMANKYAQRVQGVLRQSNVALVKVLQKWMNTSASKHKRTDIGKALGSGDNIPWELAPLQLRTKSCNVPLQFGQPMQAWASFNPAAGDKIDGLSDSPSMAHRCDPLHEAYAPFGRDLFRLVVEELLQEAHHDGWFRILLPPTDTVTLTVSEIEMAVHDLLHGDGWGGFVVPGERMSFQRFYDPQLWQPGDEKVKVPFVNTELMALADVMLIGAFAGTSSIAAIQRFTTVPEFCTGRVLWWDTHWKAFEEALVGLWMNRVGPRDDAGETPSASDSDAEDNPFRAAVAAKTGKTTVVQQKKPIVAANGGAASAGASAAKLTWTSGEGDVRGPGAACRGASAHAVAAHRSVLP